MKFLFNLKFLYFQVLWQVYKASSSLTSSVWDFIFYGLRGNDIQATAGRENSGTTALIFRASNGRRTFLLNCSLWKFDEENPKIVPTYSNICKDWNIVKTEIRLTQILVEI